MTTPCPYCQTPSARLFFTKDRNRRITLATFSYYRCPSCRLIFLRPVPVNLEEYYPTDYYPVPASLAEFRASSENERFKLDLITRYVRTGKLLEVGPAFGNFAYLAKQAGFDVEVIEMDSRCCKFLRDVAGVKTIQSSDAVQAVRDRGPYDVIAMWHVIEHITDFGQTLAALAEKVNPGGFFVLAAPNPDAWQFNIFGRYWTHVDAPRHVVLIPVALLVAHMRTLGFSEVSATMTDPGGVGWNYFGWQVSLSNFAKCRFIKSALYRLGTMLTFIMKPIEQNDRKGSAYTIIFRKDG